MGIRDPSLGTVDDPAVAGINGCGRSSTSVTAIARLGEHEATQTLTTRCRLQELLLLFIVGPFFDWSTVERVVDRHDHPCIGTPSTDFFHGNGIREIIKLRTTPLCINHHAEETKFTHFLHLLCGELVLLVDLSGDRDQFFFGKCATHFRDGNMLFAEERPIGIAHRDRATTALVH
jgi:hypothetical protein